MGSGQAPEARCSQLYSSCCRAPSLSILRMVSHCRILQSSCPSRFLWAASSSHSCLCIRSRVARAASFSFSRAASLSRTSPNVNSGEGITFLRGGLEAASEWVTTGPWWSSCIVTTGGRPDLIRVLVHLSPCSDLPTGGEGVDHPLPAPLALSASMPANPWPLPVLHLAGLLTAPLPTPLLANALFGEEAGFCRITLCTSPPVTLLEEVLILGAVLGDGRQNCLSSGRKHSHYLHSPTRHHSG